jgi:preprotein translocase subunit SecE
MAMEVAERPAGPVGFFGRQVEHIRNIPRFTNEVIAEMAKVTWPDRQQLKDTTIKLIIFVLFLGAVIGVIDLVMQLVLVQGLPSLFSGK